MLALGERIVLRLDDLVPLIQEDVKWVYGSNSPCSDAGNNISNDLASSKNVEGSSLKNRWDNLLILSLPLIFSCLFFHHHEAFRYLKLI